MDLIDSLVANRARFVSFVASRVPDRAVAEDIVQLAFARVVEKRAAPTDEARSLAWFYRILLNAVTDFHRRRGAEARGRERFASDPTTMAEAGPRHICGCVRRALAELPERSQEILVDVEVGGMTVSAYATKADISSGNASVRLHRARRLLSATLRNICGTCSLDGCADCDCGHHVRS
jgi:RNA polymerase sigma-70 factor (ECF subfamily)